MWQDPIIKETRELREFYASKFNHDTDAIFKDICDRQAKTDRKKLTFPARRPLKRQNIA